MFQGQLFPGGVAKISAEPDSTTTVSLPITFSLSQNYPNPFNPVTTIRYSIEKTSHVKLQIYNILGKLVETLVDEERLAGPYSLSWDGARFASGVYFYRLDVGNRAVVKKMLLMK